ncbi:MULTISPECIES: alpha/beta fold hydrolase [unclassified Janibacter]|uniref:alpha/beta fold hydrolase n=1 Tax=unclassified Janibacter TaxID=2649294 RepID=UPI003CFDA97F
MDTFTRDGLTFDVDDDGPRDGEVVVLLHGWPQDRAAWRRVTPNLNAAGYRTLAPDQRGYSPGARPTAVSAYRLPELLADVIALIDAAGVERAHVVGHDWGGGLAWALAEARPDRVASLTVLSTPHPRAMQWALLHGDQARRSWYMAAFQIPKVPEWILGRRLERMLTDIGLPAEDAARYGARFRVPGAATAGINWYRALVSPRGVRTGATGGAGVTVPTTFVWGRDDPALGRAAAERTAAYVSGDYAFVDVDAGHWLPETCAEVVVEQVLARIRSSR